jgi:hypothetical protein
MMTLLVIQLSREAVSKNQQTNRVPEAGYPKHIYEASKHYACHCVRRAKARAGSGRNFAIQRQSNVHS